MKTTILTLAAVITFAFAANAQTPATTTTPAQVAPNPNAADFKFETDNHDFGNIKEGVQATYDFKFTNVGKEPLVITNVQASCGCTTPKWPKEPIKPGESGMITAVYNSNGRPNAFQKAITVYSNAKTPTKVLNIKGFVDAAPAEQPAQMSTTPVNNGGPKAAPKF